MWRDDGILAFNDSVKNVIQERAIEVPCGECIRETFPDVVSTE